ncbi:alpha-L-fucosidase [Arachidicoccus sp.]|uniref:alpha-L-fucosidase n=1 Tax=Arachidicoccus sp. TaxID=1872624 RepID=UPI003D20CC9B
MRKNGLIILLAFAFPLMAIAQTTIGTSKLKWWQDAKFGLFFHWGLYSVAAGDWNGRPYKGNEHFMLYERIPWKIYGQTLATKFDPVKFDADVWVKMAKNAGMKYIVITAKHHDGFAMYHSPSSDYNIVKKTPWGKDPMKLLSEACKKYGIKLCFYYSLGRDWQDPDVPTNWPVKGGRSNTWDYPNEDKKDIRKYFERKVKPQVKELLTQYGPIGVIWFDTPEMITRQQSKELREMIHKLQPDCIINGRIGNGYGDYSVSEQKIEGKIDLHPWESCVTLSGGWGYNKYDSAWKSPELLIRQLTETVSKGGNYLLNVGPMGNGEFPRPAVQRLAAIGKWMHINGEAVYGTRPWHIALEKVEGALLSDDKSPSKTLDKNMVDVLNDVTPKNIFPEIRFTQKGGNIYVFANSIQTTELHVKALGAAYFKRIRSISILGGRRVDWKQQTGYVTIKMPKKKKGSINIYVFKVD